MAERIRDFRAFKVHDHDQKAGFVEALEDEQPSRVFIEPFEEGVTNEHRLSFLDKEGDIHEFYNKTGKLARPVRVSLPKLRGLNLVAGRIDISVRRDPQIFMRFQAVYPLNGGSGQDFSAADERRYFNWFEAVQEEIQLKPERVQPLLQVYRNIRGSLSVDMTVGIHHLVAILGKHKDFALEDLKTAFPEVPVQDNTDILEWGRYMPGLDYNR
jgi:hypothetical protein